MTGHFKKAGVAPMRYIGEVRIEDSKDETKAGDRVLVDGFKVGEYVDVSGVSKGKGFQGGVKRWHYRGGEASHGSMFHRAPGGIGASSFPSRVWKGQHFPGHMGNERKTSKNLRVVKIDADENLLLVCGAVPGPAGSYILYSQGQRSARVRHERDDNARCGREKSRRQERSAQMELADDVFSAKVNPNLLHEAVRHYLAGKRAGTHKTKDKSEVSGSGRKLWKQKGTGRARIGSIRSPLWRHGGTVHGPVPRSYDYALPKKMIVGALRSALSAKLAEEKLTVVDGWELESHKTKPFRQALSKLENETRTILLVETART